jgi:hypothetical protein
MAFIEDAEGVETPLDVVAAGCRRNGTTVKTVITPP